VTENTWFGVAPSDWQESRLKYLADFQAGEHITAESIRPEAEFPVYGGNGLRGFADQYTHDGKYVLVGRQGALCGNVNYAEGKFWASEHAVVVKPRTGVHVQWIGELLRAMNLGQYSMSAAQPGLSVEYITNLPVLVPPFETQRRIADYLDRETSGIDSLLAEKERLLELLAEKRRALITRAVTRGLDPAVPLRDSGLAWLGAIPEHWQVERTKWLFRERRGRSESGDEELLTVSHLTGVTPRSEKDVTMFEAESTEGYKICRRGDLAINTLWAWMGAMGVSPCDGIVSPSYHVYVLSDQLDGGYVDALVRTPQFAQEVLRVSKGVWSSRLRLYPENFFELYIHVPPLAEQQAIVDWIGRETGKLNALQEAAERTVGLLRDRRASLIAAAVTGKLEIT